MAEKKAIKLEQLEELAQRARAKVAALNEKLSDIKIPEYTLARQETPEEGFASTYQLKKDGVAIGEKINIPKDIFVQDVSNVLTVAEAGKPVNGYKVGDKYIDFTIATTSKGSETKHLYLLVTDLCDVYTGDNKGVVLGAGNVFSLKIDAANANGLSVGGGGLGLALASTTKAGAMSGADKAKLDDITFATDAEVEAMLNEVFGTEDAGA